MIHRGHHRNNGLAICKGKYRNFRPCQKFFYNNGAAAFAEHLVFHHALDSLFCFFQIGCNDNAFSQSQTICFDDGRELIFLLDVCNGCICIVENFILCGRNVILLHQFLGECFAAFDDCSRLIRAKGCKSSCLHGIDHTQYQRVIRCNKNQINCQLLCQCNHAFYIGCLHRKAFCIFGDSAVSRCTVQGIHLFAFFQFADDGVFSAAAANN